MILLHKFLHHVFRVLFLVDGDVRPLLWLLACFVLLTSVAQIVVLLAIRALFSMRQEAARAHDRG